MFHLVVLSIFVKKKYFSFLLSFPPLNLSFTEHSHTNSLFAKEEKKCLASDVYNTFARSRLLSLSLSLSNNSRFFKAGYEGKGSRFDLIMLYVHRLRKVFYRQGKRALENRAQVHLSVRTVPELSKVSEEEKSGFLKSSRAVCAGRSAWALTPYAILTHVPNKLRFLWKHHERRSLVKRGVPFPSPHPPHPHPPRPYCIAWSLPPAQPPPLSPSDHSPRHKWQATTVTVAATRMRHLFLLLFSPLLSSHLNKLTTELVEVLLYVHTNRRLIRDGSLGRTPRLSHSSWVL